MSSVSHLPHHHLFLGQQLVAGLIRHVVLGPGECEWAAGNGGTHAASCDLPALGREMIGARVFPSTSAPAPIAFYKGAVGITAKAKGRLPRTAPIVLTSESCSVRKLSCLTPRRCPEIRALPAELRSCTDVSSYLPCHHRLLLGQEPVSCFVADVVLRPRIHVIHIDLVAGDTRDRPNELAAVREDEQSRPFPLHYVLEPLPQKLPLVCASTPRRPSDKQQIDLEFSGAGAVSWHVRKPALLLGEGRTGNVG
jgi:hypothetical protein